MEKKDAPLSYKILNENCEFVNQSNRIHSLSSLQWRNKVHTSFAKFLILEQYFKH
jgi:hypothetical protein